MKIYLNNLEETQLFAEKLAKIVEIGDIITFTGNLGVGKTSFIQFFIKSLAGNDVEVTSPTFNLVYTYTLEQFEIWHFDLYRLKDQREIYELGIEDAFIKGVSLIEWPEIIENILPNNRLDIGLFFGEKDDERVMTISGFGRWDNKLIELREDL
jgi:tRNA threonylcarbamoyl adenosine modification protein YjeE